MFLLDTDILSLIELAKPRVLERLNRIDPSEVTTTVITRIEMLRGRFDSVLKAANAAELLKAQKRLAQTEQLLDELDIVTIDSAAAVEFDKLRENKKLKKIGRGDLLIACIALAQRATLVTRNVSHFQMIPGLKLENWAD